MNEKPYDPYEGMYRIAGAAETLSKDAVEVTTLHVALEREVEAFISSKLKRSEHLNRLSFIQKAAVLYSCWDGTHEEAEKIYSVLNAFNDLRNRYAHGNSGIDQCHSNLVNAYCAINPKATEPISYTEIAQAICAFIGGGMMPGELKIVADLLKKAVKSGPTVPQTK